MYAWTYIQTTHAPWFVYVYERSYVALLDVSSSHSIGSQYQV